MGTIYNKSPSCKPRPRPFSNNPSNGANYFESIWLAAGITGVALLAVTVVLVPPDKKRTPLFSWERPGPRPIFRLFTSRPQIV